MGFLSVIAILALRQTPPSAIPPVAQSILANFDSWDRDSDGALSREEIRRAFGDPNFHDRASAALVSLTRWTDACKITPPMTKAWFEAYRPTKQVFPPKTPKTEIDRSNFEYGFALQSVYSDALWQIRQDPHVLYTHGSPRRVDIRQGGWGDCSFLSALGATTHRNPDTIKRMIMPQGDGWDVTFGDGQTVHVENFTDAQMARGGGSMAGGRWLRIMEHAYIRRKPYSLARVPGLKRFRGLMQPAETMTGSRFRLLRLVGNYLKPVTTASLNQLVIDARRELSETLSNQRIATVCTSHAKMPNGIVGGHWYAVLKFDPINDEVTVWNPWGDTWIPKNQPGAPKAYGRINGESRMPTADFVQIFESVLLETDMPCVQWEPTG